MLNDNKKENEVLEKISEKDLKKIKTMITDFYFVNDRIPTIEEFTKIFEETYKYEVSDFFKKINMPYYIFLRKLGYVRIRTSFQRYKYYNKPTLEKNIRNKYNLLTKKNKVLLSKDMKKNFGITLKEAKLIFNIEDYVDFINMLGGNHPLTLSKNTKKFFEELKHS